jgi:dTDP-4-amino-4,6-dideoxygalactose transaminase
MGCFSFHPRKVVTCGEGGMVTTDDPVLATRLRLLRNHGARKTSTRAFEFVEAGFNYRLSEIPAAMGISQMRRIDEIVSDRRMTAARYDSEVSSLPGVQILNPPADAHWSYQSYVVLFDESIDRDEVMSRMNQEGIETTVGTYACHQQPVFSKWGYRPGDLPNSDRFANTTLTLPLIPRMAVSQVERVVETLSSILGSF